MEQLVEDEIASDREAMWEFYNAIGNDDLVENFLKEHQYLEGEE